MWHAVSLLKQNSQNLHKSKREKSVVVFFHASRPPHMFQKIYQQNKLQKFELKSKSKFIKKFAATLLVFTCYFCLWHCCAHINMPASLLLKLDSKFCHITKMKKTQLIKFTYMHMCFVFGICIARNVSLNVCFA